MGERHHQVLAVGHEIVERGIPRLSCAELERAELDPIGLALGLVGQQSVLPSVAYYRSLVLAQEKVPGLVPSPAPALETDPAQNPLAFDFAVAFAEAVVDQEVAFEVMSPEVLTSAQLVPDRDSSRSSRVACQVGCEGWQKRCSAWQS